MSSRSKNVVVSLAVLGTLLTTFAVVATPLYFVGKSLEDERRFLKIYRSPNELEMETHIRMKYVVDSNEPYEVIFLGDSGCYFDISPELFAKQCDLRSFNLGMPGVGGGRPVALVLRRYLESHPSPKVVVVTISADRFDGKQKFKTAYDRFLWCYGKGDEEPRPPHDNPLRHFVSEGGLHLYGAVTGGIEPRLKTKIQGAVNPHATYENFAQTIAECRGFCDFLYYPFDGTRNPPFVVNAENEAKFDEIAETCARRGITLIVRLAPFFEADAPTEWPELTAWADRFERKHPSAKVARPLVMLYPKEWMADTRHCNKEGVQRFTRVVGDEVNAALGKAKTER